MTLSRFKLSIILQVILLALTTGFFFLALDRRNLPVTTFNLAAIWILQLILLIRYLQRVNRDLERFFAAFRFNDGTMRFDLQHSDKVFRPLHEQMNRILTQFTEIQLGKQRQQELYQQAIEQSATGLCAFTADGRVQLVNASFLRLFGLKECRNVKQLDNAYPGVQQSIMELKPYRKKILELKTSSQPLRISANGSQMKIGKEKIMLVSFDNVKTETELAEIEAWQKMTRVISHEILNSVSPISLMASGLLELYQAQAEPLAELREKTIDSLGVIHKRSRHLIRFIESYRTFAKLPVPVKKPFAVSRLFGQVKILFSEELNTRSISINTSTIPENISLTADEKLVEQVLINLVKNALEATTERSLPQIGMEAYQEEGRVKIRVTDNGKGIPDEIAGQLFVPFFTTKAGGSGIGLNLARQIMSLHGGSISFQSTVDTGTCFVLEF